MAKPVGPVEGKQFESFLPGGGLAAFLEGQDIFPVVALANGHDGLAAVEGVGHQAEGQFRKLSFEPLTQALEAFEFAVLFLGFRVVQVHLLVHEREECPLGADDGELQDVAVASAVGRGLAILCKALAAFFLHTTIDHHDIPAVKEPDAIKQTAIQQIVEHQHRDLGYQFGVHAAGVAGRVIGTGDGGHARKAGVLGSLTAQDTQVPSGFAGLSLLVKAVARALAAEKGGEDLPPEMGGRVEAHLLDARVGQAVEPLIEAGENGPHDPHQSLRR